ncbi:peptidase MA family metallohydrolase, partial [Acidobacteriota bacterium]
DFWKATDAPSWVGGLYDQKIRVPVKGLKPGDQRHEKVLKHELVHALIHVKCGGACPRWLNEGLAQYYEGVSINERIRSLRRTSPTWRQDLLRGFGQAETPELFYTRSLSVTKYLIEKEGKHKVMDLLEALVRTRDERKAFRQAFRRDPEQIFENWHRWAERQYR